MSDTVLPTREDIRKAQLDFTGYCVGRGWSVWQDDLLMVIIDRLEGREAVVTTSSLMREVRSGVWEQRQPGSILRMIGHENGWHKVREIRRPGAINTREEAIRS